MLYKKVHCNNLKSIQEEFLLIMPEENKTENIYRSYDKEYFVSCFNLIDFVNSVKAWKDIDEIAIVSTKANDKLPIHRDNDEIIRSTVYALNFPILNCDETYTAFYEIENGIESLLKTQDHGNEYLYYEEEKTKEIDRLYLKNSVYWVNTQVAHNAVNMTELPRVILSIRFKTKILL